MDGNNINKMIQKKMFLDHSVQSNACDKGGNKEKKKIPPIQ